MSDLDKARKGFEQFVEDQPVVQEIIDMDQPGDQHHYERPPAIEEAGTERKPRTQQEKAREGFEQFTEEQPVVQEIRETQPQRREVTMSRYGEQRKGIEPKQEVRYVTYTPEAWQQHKEKTYRELHETRQEYRREQARLYFERFQYSQYGTPEYERYTQAIKDYDKAIKQVDTTRQEITQNLPGVKPYTVIKREVTDQQMGDFVFLEDPVKKADYEKQKQHPIISGFRDISSIFAFSPQYAFASKRTKTYFISDKTV